MKPGDMGLIEVTSVTLVLFDPSGQLRGSEYVEDVDCLRRLVCEVDSLETSLPADFEASSPTSSGIRSADLGGGASDDFGGLNLSVMAFPVREAELSLEGSFFGLVAMSFSSK